MYVRYRPSRPPAAAGPARRPPGWERLWLHSYRLGARWLVRGAPGGRAGWRVGLNRLLVPLDPWRYFELGRVADDEFGGVNLDVSSPKLLASLFRREGRGAWVGIDRCEAEVRGWRGLDPDLPLAVCDATRLPFADGAFDHCLCLSVVEHLPGDADAAAMAEMWRVLKPGGVLHLTTNVARRPREVYTRRPVYGEGSVSVEGRVFFERHYTPTQVSERLLRCPWQVARVEYARQVTPLIETLFYALRPWTYPLGGLLRWVCPGNFQVGATPAVLPETGHGVVYAKLCKPAGEAPG